MNSAVVARRRRVFFWLCKNLGIDDYNQKLLADQFIPDKDRNKFNRDGEISRKPLFNDSHVWNRIYIHLMGLYNGRRLNHKRLDGSNYVMISERQLNYILGLGRQLGWDEFGEDDMRLRLGLYASRRTLGESPSVVRLVEHLTAKQASDMIKGLIAMVDHAARQTA